MAHRHSIYDADKHFQINPVTRMISNPSNKLTLIQYDHNSELFGFAIPRYIEGHDMSLCNRVEVHYINIGTKSQNAGVYEVSDLQILPEDEETVTCTWLISQNATQLVGGLHFVVRYACVEEDDTISYDWNTAIYSGVKVASGIRNSEHIVEEYVDVLEEWKQALYAEGLKISTVEQTATSTEDNGVNEITFTMTDGSTNIFTVRNGSKGDTGDKGDSFTYSDFTTEQLKSLTGPKGDAGVSIESITRTSGTGAAGTTDTYTVTLTDGTVGGTFNVYNGANGTGAGDMTSNTYDPQGKAQDIFAYVDGAISKVPEVPTKVSAFENDNNYVTQGYVDDAVGDIAEILDSINGEVI